MKILAAQLLAVALFLLPILTLWIARLTKRTAAWEIALDIPLGVAASLLSVFVLARFMTVESAALVSRALWAFALGVVLYRRRHSRPAWPVAIGWLELAAVLASCGLAILICLPISRNYSIWDRAWHSPLVPSLAGQTIPFMNVYGASEALHYHTAGDLGAAMLRAFSWNTISSNLALSLAHDLLFAISAAVVALLSIWFGTRRFFPIVLAGVALLMHGPIPLRGDIGGAFDGFAYHLFLSLSYRPHVPFALLFAIGFISVVAIRVRRPDVLSPRRAVSSLVLLTALLGVSDEASVGMLGLALGTTWLAFPNVLSPSRWRGVLALFGLALAVLLPNVLFSGSLAPGTPVTRLSWLPDATMPAVVGAVELPLSTANGKIAFALDFLPFCACFLGLMARAPGRLPFVVFAGLPIVTCAVLVTHLRVNDTGIEAQRFFVTPFLVATLLGLFQLPSLARGSAAALLIVLGAAVPAIFTVRWLTEAPGYLRGYGEGPESRWAKQRTYGLDCREVAGARLGQRPRPTYVDRMHHYVYTACRPVFASGIPILPWTVLIEPQYEPLPQLADLHRRMVPSDVSLDVICPTVPPRDVVCTKAVASGSGACTPEGTGFLRCNLGPGERAAILAK